MNITERDIKESLEYKGTERTANTFMILGISLGFLLTGAWIGTSIVCQDIMAYWIWIPLIAASQLAFWFSYGNAKKRLARFLKSCQEMYYVEPIFGRADAHYRYKNTHSYDFTVAINHNDKIINVKTKMFLRARGGIFGYKYYEGHKIACLYDPKKPRYLYIIKRID